MKLGTLKSEARDGELAVVSRDNRLAVKVPDIAPHLQYALDHWDRLEGRLKEVYRRLNAGEIKQAFAVDEKAFHSPLPRAYQWLDGSAFLQHVRLVRRARGADLPESLLHVPLMYQGGGDSFLAPRDPIPFLDPAYGLDFEGEVGVITGDVPMGCTPRQAADFVRLFVIVNDVSLRGLIPDELGRGFGFMQSKPSSAFAPFALTPDELGDAWRDGRVHLPLCSEYNGDFFGRPNAGEMHFSFYDLIAHAARTRVLSAGSIVGSGTVSNRDESVGSSCLAEKRMLEKIRSGESSTPFMQPGDTIKMEMSSEDGRSLFGTILQAVERR